MPSIGFFFFFFFFPMSCNMQVKLTSQYDMMNATHFCLLHVFYLVTNDWFDPITACFDHLIKLYNLAGQHVSDAIGTCNMCVVLILFFVWYHSIVARVWFAYIHYFHDVRHRFIWKCFGGEIAFWCMSCACMSVHTSKPNIEDIVDFIVSCCSTWSICRHWM